MYATVRRYRGIDTLRSEEIAHKVTESLVPTMSGLSGFAGYFLFDSGEDTIASVSVFESPGEAHA